VRRDGVSSVCLLTCYSLRAVEFRRQLDADRAKLLKRAEKEAVCCWVLCLVE
jgi:hypothetical protein